MNDVNKSDPTPKPRPKSKGAGIVTYWASIFKRMPDLRTTRTPLLALVATGAVATVAIATLGALLSGQVHAVKDLQAEFTSKSDNYDSLRSDWSTQNDTIAGLRSTVGAAESREENLTAAEAALTTRDAELTARSTTLDEREGAIKGAEDVAAANTFGGDGTFRVGADIQPGTYTSAGGSNCYWARLNAAGDDIIDNNISSGPAVVTVQASDGLVKTSRCAPFTKSG
jgi:hypothetical protein